MKNLRILFWLVVVGAAIYTGWMVVPAFIANYRLKESIDDSARSAAVNNQRTEDEIRRAVYLDAKDLQIPLKPEDIKVERSGGDVFISADYTVHVDLLVHPFDLEFHPSSKRETLTFR
jgi:hypothetical protein